MKIGAEMKGLRLKTLILSNGSSFYLYTYAIHAWCHFHRVIPLMYGGMCQPAVIIQRLTPKETPALCANAIQNTPNDRQESAADIPQVFFLQSKHDHLALA